MNSIYIDCIDLKPVKGQVVDILYDISNIHVKTEMNSTVKDVIRIILKNTILLPGFCFVLSCSGCSKYENKRLNLFASSFIKTKLRINTSQGIRKKHGKQINLTKNVSNTGL